MKSNVRSSWPDITFLKSVPADCSRLQPISDSKAYADGAFIGVVINLALALAGKTLDISFDVFVVTSRKTPGTINRSPAETGLQVIA